MSDPIAIHLFHDPDLVFPLKMAFVGAFGVSFWHFFLAIYQAQEKFLRYSALETFFNFIRASCLVGLFLAAKLTVTNVILTITAVFYFSMVLGFVFLPRGVFRDNQIDKKVKRDLVGFCKWVFLGDIILIFYYKQDILILNYFRGPDAVGLYSAAFAILLVIEHLINALLVVQLPAVSKLSSLDEYKKYIRRAFAISSLLVTFIIPIFFLAEPLIITFFSESYYLSVGIFRIIFFGVVIRIFLYPLALLFFSIGRPDIPAAILSAMLVCNLFGNLLFVPMNGENGAAWVKLATWMGEGILIGFCIYRFVLSKNSQMVQNKKIS
jgi:O-antigen/teichoic acid export membrane protein